MIKRNPRQAAVTYVGWLNFIVIMAGGSLALGHYWIILVLLVASAVLFFATKWPRYFFNNFAWSKKTVIFAWPAFLILCLCLHFFAESIVVALTGFDLETANEFMIPFLTRALVIGGGLSVAGYWFFYAARLPSSFFEES